MFIISQKHRIIIAICSARSSISAHKLRNVNCSMKITEIWVKMLLERIILKLFGCFSFTSSVIHCKHFMIDYSKVMTKIPHQTQAKSLHLFILTLTGCRLSLIPVLMNEWPNVDQIIEMRLIDFYSYFTFNPKSC